MNSRQLQQSSYPKKLNKKMNKIRVAMVTAHLHGSSISLMVSTCLEAILQFIAKSSQICISKASDSHPYVLEGHAPHAISKAQLVVRPGFLL